MAVDGRDDADGSKAHPLATLQAAREAVRKRMMRPSRWPNKGFAHIGKVHDVGAIHAHGRTPGKPPKADQRRTRIGGKRGYAGRFGQHHGPGTARWSLPRAKKVLVHSRPRDRITEKARDGRGLESIRDTVGAAKRNPG